MTTAVALALLIALVPGRLGKFWGFGLQKLIERFLYADLNQFLKLALDNFFV